MGQKESTVQKETKDVRPALRKHQEVIRDRFHSLEEVNAALRRTGLESSNLILGIDFTKSNIFTGRKTFGARPLHQIVPGELNPYEKVLTVLRNTLELFDDDKLIPTYGFGDAGDADSPFPFFTDRVPYGFSEVLHRYREIAPTVTLRGPTDYASIIYEAVHVVQELRAYHILLIISDGQVVDERSTIDAIVDASQYPLSIVMIGVGDGPWDQMEEFDDHLPKRKFDNFQFVQFHKIMAENNNDESAFALNALMEIPEQYKQIVKKNMLYPLKSASPVPQAKQETTATE